jgi:gliding motility associated protien GldN
MITQIKGFLMAIEIFGLKVMNKSCIIFLLFTGASLAGMAQEKARNADQMYKKTIVRALDLRERQNKPLFAKNREITGILIEAIEKGNIKAYKNDSLSSELSIDEFKQRMAMPSTEPVITDPDELRMMYPDDWEERLAKGPQIDYYFPKDLYQLEIRENLIFDKQRSRMVFEIEAITIYIPADHPANIKGIQEPIASFNYKDVQKLLSENPNAVWYNEQNDAQHKNLADAFELRLFSFYIIKVSNADDAYLTDIYRDQYKGLMASQWVAYELMEFEHHLWEF